MIPTSKFCRYRPDEVLENQILAFFDRNPEEELTSADVAIKFDRGQHKVREKLKRLTDQGLIGRYGIKRRGGQVEYVYRRAS